MSRIKFGLLLPQVGLPFTVIKERVQLAERLAPDGGQVGVAVSVDSLRPSYHDNFRHGEGSLAATQAALGRLRAHEAAVMYEPSGVM